MNAHLTDRTFLMFLKMRDSEVKKILDRDCRSAIYMIRSGNLNKVLARVKNRYFLSDGAIITDPECYKYSYQHYLDDKNNYKNHFFMNAGQEATADYIKRRAEFYYGEENVWLDKRDFSVIIKFPEVEINNSVDDSHIMKDIFFKIKPGSNKGITFNIARTTVNEDEYSRYIFSHTSENCPGVYSDQICFGSTDLRNWIDSAIITNNFINIDKIIASLYGYLSWESLEGKPYKYMSLLRSPAVVGSRAYSYPSGETDIALKIIYNSDLKLIYTLVNQDDFEQRIDIVNKDEVENLLKHKEITQYYKYEYGDYSDIKRRDKHTNLESDVEFKGDVVPVVIEDSKTELNCEKSCHSMLLQYVIKNLQKELLKFIKENDSN